MWLSHSKAKYCELCGHQFEFTPIYADNAPTVLPPHEIIFGLIKRASSGIQGVLRVALVLLCWFIIVPMATSSVFYLYFGRPISFVMDCAFGTFISAMVIFVCLLIMSLMDFVNNLHIVENNIQDVQNPAIVNPAPIDLNNFNPALPAPDAQQEQQNEQQQEEVPPLEESGDDGNDDEQEDDEELNEDDDDEDGLLREDVEDGIPKSPPAAEPIRAILQEIYQQAQEKELERELNGDADREDELMEDFSDSDDDSDNDGESDGQDTVDNDEEDQQLNHEDPDALIAHYNEVMAMFDQIPHADFQLPQPQQVGIDDNVNNNNNVNEAEPIDEENAFGNMFFGFLDGNGGGEVDFNELVGVVGPLKGLLAKAIALILINACFLALFALLPLALGRFLLQLRHYPVVFFKILATWCSSVLSVMQFNSTSVIQNITAAINSTLDYVGVSSAAIVSATVDNATLSSAPLANASLALSNITLNVTKATYEFGTGDVDAVVVGYLFIGITLSLSSSFVLSRSPFYRTVIRSLKLVLTAVKVVCVMFSELGLFPLLVGNALDFCTLALFGISFDTRVAACRRNPLICQTLHWGLGFAYMILFASFVGWVREVVRPGVLWFFRDPSDPNFNPLKDIVDQPATRHVKRLLLSALIYAVIIGLVVFLPILVGKILWPTLFPLNIWLGDPFYEGPIDLIFVHVIVPYTLEYCHPKANFKALLSKWVVFASHKLGIAEYMLPPPTPAPANPPVVNPVANAVAQVIAHPVANPAAVAANLAAVIANNPNLPPAANANPPYKPPLFPLRVVAILNCAWISMFILNSMIVTIPIVTGRFVFSQLAFPLTNDLYTFSAGFYLLYGVIRVTKAVVTFATSLPLPQIVSELYLYSIMGFKCTIVGLFLGIFIPALIGLVFELIIAIPWRVSIDQSPHFFIYQDWGLGLIYMKIWYRVIAARADYIRLHPAAIREGYDGHAIKWNAKIDQIYQDGFRNMNLTRIFTSVIFPILDKILLMLCVPYAISKGLVPLLGGSVLLVSAVYRYGFLCMALIVIITKLQGPLIYSFRSLHNAIRDDKYLVGRQLHNYSTSMN